MQWSAITSLIGAACVSICCVGCGVKSDSILADQDAGTPFQQGSPMGLPAFSDITDYEGCDVDLTCTEGCDTDLDCGEDNSVELAREGAAPLADGESVTLEPGQSAWWSWTAAGDFVIGAEGADGVVELAVYDQASEALMARSTDLPALRVIAAEETPMMVRAASAGGPVTFTLRMAAAE